MSASVQTSLFRFRTPHTSSFLLLCISSSSTARYSICASYLLPSPLSTYSIPAHAPNRMRSQVTIKTIMATLQDYGEDFKTHLATTFRQSLMVCRPLLALRFVLSCHGPRREWCCALPSHLSFGSYVIQRGRAVHCHRCEVWPGREGVARLPYAYSFIC